MSLIMFREPALFLAFATCCVTMILSEMNKQQSSHNFTTQAEKNSTNVKFTEAQHRNSTMFNITQTHHRNSTKFNTTQSHHRNRTDVNIGPANLNSSAAVKFREHQLKRKSTAGNFTQFQIAGLEGLFQHQRFPSRGEIDHLSKRIGASPSKIEKWFSKRRDTWRRIREKNFGPGI